MIKCFNKTADCMGSSAYKIPRLNPGVDVLSLPLNTSEGFVLSCIDGMMSIEDISYISGIDLGQTCRVMRRLVELGAVEWSDEDASGKKTRTSVTPKSKPERAGRERELTNIQWGAIDPRIIQKVIAAGRHKVSDRPSAEPGAIDSGPPPSGQPVLYDPAELEEDVELPIEKRKLILDTYHRSERQNLYQLLGVPQSADHAQIRAAYFELSRVFHPDSEFGKRLGSFKSKMEAVFKRLTEAYDVLGKKPRRREYDDYLTTTAQTKEAQEALARGLLEAEVLKQVVGGKAASKPASDRPEPTADRHREILPPPEELPAEERLIRTPVPPASLEERRQRMQKLLFKRLEGATGRSISPLPGSLAYSPAPSDRPAITQDDHEDAARRDSVLRGLANSLKEVSEVTGRGKRISEQLASAKELEKQGHLIEAANCLRLAVTFEPDREDIRAEYRRVSALVASDLADRYERRAQYEERAGKWKVAADSWGKVSEGRPRDSVPPRKAAEMLLKAGADVNLAKKYAERAVELNPEKAANLEVLARVYLACGLRSRARQELQKALKLDPKNDVVRNLLKEIR